MGPEEGCRWRGSHEGRKISQPQEKNSASEMPGWVLGLSLQLWNSDTMKKIGDECGGWLENKEETELRNHLRWARIRCEEPATYRKRSPEKRNDDDRLKEKKSNPSTAMPMEAFQNRGMEFTEESISKYEINKKRERWIDQGHMLSVGSYLGERELCVGGPSCGQLEREMSREKEIQNQGFCGGPRKHSSFNLKGNSSPIDSGPKQKKQPFTEPFTEFINRTNTEACKSVYFVYFKGGDKLNIEAAGRRKKEKNMHLNQKQLDIHVHKKGESSMKNNEGQRIEEEVVDFSESLLVMYAESEPL
ncbi:hypothetical protein FXO37_21322 [Capsicum annuum]|nr:hypothetical protein FXO37_21322 [Capsicum annuum]